MAVAQGPTQELLDLGPDGGHRRSALLRRGLRAELNRSRADSMVRASERSDMVWRFRLVGLILALACSGCATAGVDASDIESVAKGEQVTLLVLGTGNKWMQRTEPDLHMVVKAQTPTPAAKVQTDLTECQTAARTVWNSAAAESDRTILASAGPAYNPGAEISRSGMELLARTYANCLQPKGYVAGPPTP